MAEQKPVKEKEIIHINTTIITATTTTILPLLVIFVIPNIWWGILIKIFLAMLILSFLRNYFFHPMWEKARGFAAGVVFNMALFSIFWFSSAEAISFACVVLFLLTLGTMKYMLGKHYDNAP